jgi:hypothetical protein
MVLFHDVIEILALPDGDGGLVPFIIVLNGGRVAPTLINRDRL